MLAINTKDTQHLVRLQVGVCPTQSHGRYMSSRVMEGEDICVLHSTCQSISIGRTSEAHSCIWHGNTPLVRIKQSKQT